jgi:hypothetical protein
MGPSGSGKSTLLNLLGLLDVVDSGDYRLAGDDVGRSGDHDLAKRRNSNIGFIFQSFNLFPQLDVVGNIEVPMVYGRRPVAPAARARQELAETVGLGHRLRHRPRHLSGGEMQRTAIARALANEPPLLLADEPTGTSTRPPATRSWNCSTASSPRADDDPGHAQPQLQGPGPARDAHARRAGADGRVGRIDSPRRHGGTEARPDYRAASEEHRQSNGQRNNQ